MRRRPGSAIAQGSIFVVFGTNMGPATLVQAGVLPLPTALSGTSIRVTSGSTSAAAPIFYTSAGQVVGILPSNIPVGQASLTLTYNGATSPAATFQVAASNFGIITGNSSGAGPGAVTNAAGAVYGFTNAANPGETAILYGTGLGPIAGNDAAGAPFSDQTGVPVEVWVGLQRANIAFRGRTPGAVGLDQINFVIPPGVTGCRIPVAVKINNVISNFAAIAIAAAGTRTCSDPGGPTPAELARFLQNGASIGVVTLNRTVTSITAPVIGTITVNADVGAAAFSKYTPAALNVANNPFNSQAAGTCNVYWSKGSAASVDFLAKFLDAGSAITVSGAAGTKQLAKSTVGGSTLYSGLLSDPAGGLGGISGIPGLPGGGGGGGSNGFLNPGTFNITGPGGPDVGAFTTSLTLGQPFTWSNQSAVSAVTRAGGQPISWTGGDPSAFVFIGGFSSTGSGADAYTANFSCLANASAGQFTIPSFVTLSMPVTAVIQGAPIGGLYVGSYSTPKPFTASGLDQAYAVATSTAVKTLSFQ